MDLADFPFSNRPPAFGPLMWCQLRFAAELNAARPGVLPAVLHPLHDALALILSERAQECQDALSHGAGQVQVWLQTISLLQGTLEKRVRDEPTLKLVHRLDETVSTMSSLLDKLLDINQLEAGIVRPTIIDFPIKGLLDELKTEFTYHTTANGLDWRVVLSSVAVRSDPRLLEQIIRNLLSNAVKYTTEGKLLLGCRRRGDKLRIEIWRHWPRHPGIGTKGDL